MNRRITIILGANVVAVAGLYLILSRNPETTAPNLNAGLSLSNAGLAASLAPYESSASRPEVSRDDETTQAGPEPAGDRSYSSDTRLNPATAVSQVANVDSFRGSQAPHGLVMPAASNEAPGADQFARNSQVTGGATTQFSPQSAGNPLYGSSAPLNPATRDSQASAVDSTTSQDAARQNGVASNAQNNSVPQSGAGTQDPGAQDPNTQSLNAQYAGDPAFAGDLSLQAAPSLADDVLRARVGDMEYEELIREASQTPISPSGP